MLMGTKNPDVEQQCTDCKQMNWTYLQVQYTTKLHHNPWCVTIFNWTNTDLTLLYSCQQDKRTKLTFWMEGQHGVVISIFHSIKNSFVTYWRKIWSSSNSWGIPLDNISINLQWWKINPLFNVGLKH